MRADYEAEDDEVKGGFEEMVTVISALGLAGCKIHNQRL